jgi:DNA invertase Pin-like site-specific DNA recombinase
MQLQGSGAGKSRVALYARVSTTRDQDPQLQLDELRQVSQQRGWRVVGEFVDRGFSGATDSRPELDRLMQLARTGKLDAVCVWRFDRFARSTRHLLSALEEFRSWNIDFISLRDSIDTSTPTGKFTFAIIAAVGELERELIRERTVAGIEAARRRGSRPGRPHVLFDVGRARELQAKGASIRAISKTLGVAAATVHRGLRGVPKPSSKSGAADA